MEWSRIKTGRTLIVLSILTVTITLQSCLQCITGGNLHVRRNYVSNICGLANGVYVREIKVDSFHNNTPIKYTTIRSTALYREINKSDPQKLRYSRDSKNVYLWDKGKIIDTLKGPMVFEKENWYSFYSMDAHTTIYMFIDKSGDRHFEEVSGKSGLVNF